MELIEKVKALAARIEKQRASVQTEEAAKTAFVMPFLQSLGYDVFDPHVVVPEFTADVGLKKGEKVDYAIKVNDKIAILIECKGCGVNLGQTQMSQLYRYFHVTEARFAILTNGIEYWFYTDLDEPNKMDQRPFFRFSMLDHRSDDVGELQKFTSDAFDVAAILSTASNLKYSSAIKAELLKEFDNPSDEMIRLLVSRVFEGNITAKVKADFAPLVATAFKDAIRDRVSDRLVTALEVTSGAAAGLTVSIPTAAPTAPPSTVDGQEEEIVTTEEEIEGFHIVKAIVRSEVKADRVVMRDTKSYCAILLDDNNRKPLVRLYFNSKSVKYLGLFTDKQEEKVKIESLDDIYTYAERLRVTAATYDKAKAAAPV
ncbi:type I restriction enzyme HsdR N-terminal domain-containing protein [Azospirillum oryzae]|uniref:Type I restriction enzyme HsdR N-terminal domain-containing protein n=1 Tax=Azospirillum oryzae TaxID=286727 RepID=A0A6N1AUU5_9PROT|nr:type I restriction endonuclease [Azospirillum oryzae]KAA0589934.1 restriction endonuclease [Azospirillum oryzae]QKS51772.1 type I restriction enzyme HsdR N-terminal domain-containing protein [Azospirillum oryzae]GLR81399.1 restriction endonuclease or methylase [Azospirillum oryzae]